MSSRRKPPRKPGSADSGRSASGAGSGPGERTDDRKGGFVFRDRSGKLHGRGGAPSAEPPSSGGDRRDSGDRRESGFDRREGGDRRGSLEAIRALRPERPGIPKPPGPQSDRFERPKFDRGRPGSSSSRIPLPDDPGLRSKKKEKTIIVKDDAPEAFEDFAERPRKGKYKDKDKRRAKRVKSKGPQLAIQKNGPRGGSGARDTGGGTGRRRDRDRNQPVDKASLTQLRAVVDKNRKGFGFLIFDSKEYEDAFVPPREAESLFHGDRVEVSIGRDGHIKGIKVLAHRFRELVGRYQPIPQARGRGAYVIYERKRAREEVYCPNPHPTAEPGDWVRCRMDFDPDEGTSGEVVEVYGKDLPPAADVGMVAAEYNLVEEHSPKAEEEARAFKLEMGDPHRVDLREVPFITIDGETARDFDDAIYVERKGSGFVLWVAIADVSHYVKPGTALDEEARSRGTSVYFPERAFHMLPRALSESLCSLRPNEPRLTMVAKMEYDRYGKRSETEIMEAVIESKRRATYNEIQAEWEQNGHNQQWEYAPHFALYQQIRKVRNERGSIDFDLPEAEMKVKPTGEVESIKIRARVDAHRLIEEFMISANEAVTEWMLERKWPFVYRTHEEPSEDALDRFVKLANHVGVEVRLKGGPLHQQLMRVLEQLEDHPAQTLLNTAMLRSMKQAVYSAVHAPHFGLASEGYTHFTSPIRRYPDLVVHRLLRWALQVQRSEKQALRRDEREALEKELDETCEHCSYRERLASDAERESIKLKQVRAMISRMGEEFDGKVNGIVETGFFVQISDPYVEGMVSRDSLDDDFYEFNEERMIFYGRRTRRTFRIGDKVRIKCNKADIDTRQIDFGLISHEPSQPPVTDIPRSPSRERGGPGGGGSKFERGGGKFGGGPNSKKKRGGRRR